MKHRNFAAAAISAVLGLMSLALSAKESYIGADSTIVVRDYIANMEYVNGVLERVNFAGGYIDMTGDSPRYMYYETDHLGNVRAVVDETGHVCQTNNYYPYGDRFAGSASGNQYLFGGKEYNSDTGLHDFEARYADTKFGRFTSMDPMAEKYYSVSPYAYCAGNPVNFVDPDGSIIRVIVFSNDNSYNEYHWTVDGSAGYFDSKEAGTYKMGTDSYVDALTNALNELSSKTNGLNLVSALAQNEEFVLDVRMRQGLKNHYSYHETRVSWNPSEISEMRTMDGLQNSIPFVSLGHELAHAYHDMNAERNDGKWYGFRDENDKEKNIPLDEIFATHYENLLRGEHNLTFRKSYDPDNILPVLDSKGRSLYYNAAGNTNYKLVRKNDRYAY